MGDSVDHFMLHLMSGEAAFKVAFVLGAFLLSLAATRKSGASNRQSAPRGGCESPSTATLWQKTVGRSPYVPPSWVFGAVWGFLFFSTAVLWIAGDLAEVIPFAENRAIFENWVALALFLNALWSVFILLGAVGVFPVIVAHYASAIPLIAIAIISARLFFFSEVAFVGNWKTYARLYFAVYGIWMVAATALTFTSPICRRVGR